MKGPIFFYLVRLVVDEDPVFAQEAQQCLLSLVRGKESLTFFMNFVEVVFHLNNYIGHPEYNHMQAYHPGVDPAIFASFAGSLAGIEQLPLRMRIYTMMLNRMAAEHKLQVALKLAQDILSPVAEGELPLPAADSLVRDALAILSCREIRIGGTDGDEDETAAMLAATAEEEAAAGMDPSAVAAATNEAAGKAAVAAATGAVLKAFASKNLVENIVPIAMELKRFLERSRSPLQRDLTLFFKVLMQDYKKDMLDIFAANKQLASEIEYDLRQLDTTTTTSTSEVSAANRASSVRKSVSVVGGPASRRQSLVSHTPKRVVQLQSPAPSTALRNSRSSVASVTLSVPRLRKGKSKSHLQQSLVSLNTNLDDDKPDETPVPLW